MDCIQSCFKASIHPPENTVKYQAEKTPYPPVGGSPTKEENAMLRYIFKRLLQLIPMLLILSLIVFFMVRMIPGDPVKNMLGIDVL